MFLCLKEQEQLKLKSGLRKAVALEWVGAINIQGVSSLVRSTRLKGIKTNRQHKFLLNLERNYYFD